jgi:hypothetical protein
MYNIGQQVFCVNYDSLGVTTGHITHKTKKYYHVKVRYETIRCTEDEMLPIETKNVLLAKVDGLRDFKTPKHILVNNVIHDEYITEELASKWFSCRKYTVDLRTDKEIKCTSRNLNGDVTRIILWRGNQVLQNFNVRYYGSILNEYSGHHTYNDKFKMIVCENSRSSRVFNMHTLNKSRSSLCSRSDYEGNIKAASEAAILLMKLVSAYIFE